MISFVSFIILIGVLIFVHELGHFVMGKLLGVKVLAFSLGFPPKLIGKKIGETEYILGAVPLGGYVKFLGEDAGEEVSKEELARAFHIQPIWKRVVIVVMGPLMNLVFPLLVFLFVCYQSEIQPPQIGMLLSGGPAEKAGLQPGDWIIEIDGKKVYGFDDIREILAPLGGKTVGITIKRNGKIINKRVTVKKEIEVITPLDIKKEVGRIGIFAGFKKPVIQVPMIDSPAYKSGLRTGDIILAIDGNKVKTDSDLEKINVAGRKFIRADFLRPTKVEAGGGYIYIYKPSSVSISIPEGVENIIGLGIDSTDLYISSVTRGTPAYEAGIVPGDKVVKMNGQEIHLWAEIEQTLRAYPEVHHEFTLKRQDGSYLTAYIKLGKRSSTDDIKQTVVNYVFGASNFSLYSEMESIKTPDPFTRALKGAFKETVAAIELTVIGIIRIFQGRVSVKTLGGPIMIFDLAGKAAKVGAESFGRLMALISISLGIINLVPIPMLDGGMILLFVAEAVIRRSPGQKFKLAYQYVGLAIIAFLVVLVFKNDIERYWDNIVNFFK